LQEISSITKFVELQKEVERQISRGDSDKAKQAYSTLLEQYKLINDSAVADIHKSIAYDQASKLYEELAKLKQSPNNSSAEATPVSKQFSSDAKSKFKKNLPGIALLVILGLLFAGAAIFKPSFIGLAILGQTQERSAILSAVFLESSNYTVLVDRAPLSLKLSGYLSGEGTAKVYLLRGDDKILILDSSKLETNSFENACIDSCSLSGVDKTATLAIELEGGATLTISRVIYDVDISSNQAPTWKGAGYVYNIAANQEYRINAEDYFTDPDGDSLVFLSTNTESIDVAVNGNTITLKPYTGFKGQRQLTFIASDLITLTRVPVQINVG
jgi:hypothetical protein